MPAGGAPTCQELGGAGGAIPGSGGSTQGSGPPTCPVDGDGIAAGDFPTICDGAAYSFVCPATSAELLSGLICNEVTTDKSGFTRTVGCGVETIELDGDGGQSVYAASYDVTSGALTSVKVRQAWQFGSCNAFGYRAGPAPNACPGAVTFRCQHSPLSTPEESAYAGCRAPNEPGCRTCCSPSVAPYEGYCNVLTYQNASTEPPSTTYDTNGGVGGPCPCGCQPCATCKLDDERMYRITNMPDPARCDCSTVVVPDTGTGGSGPGGDPCVPYCGYQNKKQATCPGL